MVTYYIIRKVELSFANLTPEHVLKAVEKAGFEPTGQILQLNSYENRVFDVQLESLDRIIAKFYRPQRWSREAIQEEHQFLQELQQAGLATTTAISLNENEETVIVFEGLWFSLFTRIAGRMPQEFSNADLKSIGRKLALLHNVGRQSKFKHRPILSVEKYGRDSLDILQNWVAPEIWQRYADTAENILDYLQEALPKLETFRIHGDCHRGNLLNDGKQFFFVDFDDCCTGPAVQDLWMLFSGDQETLREEEDAIVEGYLELADLNIEDLKLCPALRGLRIIHYAAWIARRWQDPSFPRLFPQFETHNYWAEEVESLEKIAWQLS